MYDYKLAPDTLGAELYQHLVDALHASEPADRCCSRWVMNAEWYRECRQMADSGGWPLWRCTDPEFLFGLPVEIRNDGGVPHLET